MTAAVGVEHAAGVVDAHAAEREPNHEPAEHVETVIDEDAAGYRRCRDTPRAGRRSKSACSRHVRLSARARTSINIL
jgi:hypothetical protein